MRMGRRALAATLTLGAVLAMTDAGHAADAAALWEKNCASCHGKDGKGDTKAGKLTKVRDLTAADVRSTLNPDAVRKAITEGVVDKDTGKSRMKSYKDKFSPAEIDALVAHVLGLGGAH